MRRFIESDRLMQWGLLVGSLLFSVWFTYTEWDGLRTLGLFTGDAIKSIPDFLQEIIDYFAPRLAFATFFDDSPASVFRESFVVGAVIGALSTVSFLWINKGGIKMPALSGTSLLAGLAIAMLTYNIVGTFLNALLVGTAVAMVVSVVHDKETQEALRLQNFSFIWSANGVMYAVLGAVAGGFVGGIGAQMLNYPLAHCSYEDGVAQVQYRLGLVVTSVSAILLLVPVWSLWANRKPDTETAGYFKNRWLPYILLIPSLFFLIIFLYYPAITIFTQSTKRIIRGAPRQFDACLGNYVELSESVPYQHSFSLTIWLTLAVVAITMAIALLIALLAAQKVRGASIYRTLLIWPYAISPVVMSAIFLNMFRRGDSGMMNWMMDSLFGVQPDWLTDPTLAQGVVVAVAVWNALGFNILFYVAGLQSVPQDLLEAAAIDGANVVQRFVRITLPMLSPFTFFLLVANVTYSFYGIYGVIDVLTQGGPPLGPAGVDGKATSVLIYTAYDEAFERGAELGFASAQSVVLFLFVAAITIIQFRFVERRVTYGG